MNFTNFRLKFRRFFKKYGKIIFLLVMAWLIIFGINQYLRNRKIEPVPTYTADTHASIMDSGTSTPRSMQEPIEDMIEEYVGYCNEGNYQKAFNMLSEDCREYAFNNSVEQFMRHVLVKMPTPKKYAIQDYSNMKYDGTNIYIYEIKYTDDFLATGITNSTYAFTSENFTFYRDDNDEIQMNTGNYIYHTDIKSISENEYFKIDVIDKIVNYSIETYRIKFTNRSNYTIVVSDGAETNEIVLVLPNEVRNKSDLYDIVLEPLQEMTVEFTFPKFIDDGDTSQSLLFSSIRVMEKYSGTDDVDKEIIKSEIDNAISKFSMEVVVNK